MKALQDLIESFGDVIDSKTITAIFNKMFTKYRTMGSSQQVEKIAYHYATVKLVEMTKAI